MEKLYLLIMQDIIIVRIRTKIFKGEKTMREIINILIKRDGIGLLEAHNIVENCISDIYAAIDSEATLDELEDIVRDELGLEPDYLEYLLMEI